MPGHYYGKSWADPLGWETSSDTLLHPQPQHLFLGSREERERKGATLA